MARKRSRKPEHLPDDTNWKDQLSQIKKTLPIPEPTAQVKKEWKRYGRDLSPTLIKAAAQLRTSVDMILAYCYDHKISLDITSYQQRIKPKHFALMIKNFDPRTYRYFEFYLQDKAIQQVKQPVKQGSKPPRLRKKVILVEPAEPVKQIYNVSTPSCQWLEIGWSNVIFEDFNILVKYGNNYSRPFPIAESRKSFKFLKKYILSLKLEPLNVLLIGNQIKEVKNIEQLKDMVTILKVKHEFLEQFEKEKSVSIKSILTFIEPLSSSFLIEIAKASAEEVNCIDYLSELQDTNFKPVPAFEVVPHGNSMTTEDTFIFTVQSQMHLYLVWESTLNGRATYIFVTDSDHYEMTIQSIYDYIASHQKAKRMKLRKKDEHTAELNYHAYITHSSFSHWKEKLLKAIEKDQTT
jgi:hypothetical protein